MLSIRQLFSNTSSTFLNFCKNKKKGEKTIVSNLLFILQILWSLFISTSYVNDIRNVIKHTHPPLVRAPKPESQQAKKYVYPRTRL